MEKYSEYKESGISRIGKIPKNWEVKKLGNFLRIFSEKGFPNAQLLSVTREKGVIVRDKDNKEENHNFVPDDLSGYKHVQPGDFVINKMKSWQGSYGVSDFDGIVSPAYFTCHLRGINKDFFSTSIRAKIYTSFFMQFSKGIRVDQWDLEPTAMKSIPIIVPPEEEQIKIVSYLQRTTSQIDEVILQQNKMIELLNERKQIIVRNAVTKGIKTGVELIDRGIDWIGAVPSHWFALKLKNCISDNQSGIWGNDENKDGNDKVCIRVADFDYDAGYVTDTDLTFRSYGKEFSYAKQLHNGDLLLEKSGGGDLFPVGRVVRYNFDESIVATCSNFIQKLTLTSDFDSDYMYYLFRAMYFAKVNGKYYNQTTGIQNLKIKEYLNQVVYLPGKEEQKIIAAYLNNRCVEIDNCINSYRKQISLLKERKQIVVDNIVTGKVKI